LARKGSFDAVDQEMADIPEQIDSSQLADAVQKLKGGDKLEDMFDNMQIQVMGAKEEDKSEGSYVSDEESGDDITESHFQEDENHISQKHAKHTDLDERDREDMDYPDEVDTPLKDARKRFQKYRGIKSLKNCDWDPYENLPVEYSKIFRFENVQAELKKQRETTENEGLPINGTYLTIVLEVTNDLTFSEIESKPWVILSTLFPHECKVSTMHFKIKRTLENKEIVPSK